MDRCRKMPPLTEAELERFRTKFCVLLRGGGGGGCSFGASRCNYSHNAHWTRRCPVYLKDPCALRYLPFLCLHVQLGDGDEILDNNCIHGNFCPFAHSAEEILYHPLVYKIRPCPEYANGSCSVYYCWKAHGESELRKSRKYTIPSKKGVILPPFPGVQVVDSLNASAPIIQNLKDKKCDRRDWEGEKVVKQLHDAKRYITDGSKSINQEIIPIPTESIINNATTADLVNGRSINGQESFRITTNRKQATKTISSSTSLISEGLDNCNNAFLLHSEEFIEHTPSLKNESMELEVKQPLVVLNTRRNEELTADYYEVFFHTNEISPLIQYEKQIQNMDIKIKEFNLISDPSVSILNLAIKLVRVAYKHRIFSYSQWGRLLICGITLLLLATCNNSTSTTIKDYTNAILGQWGDIRSPNKRRILKFKCKSAGQILKETRISIYQRFTANVAQYPKTYQKYFAIQKVCRIRQALIKTISAYRCGCRLNSVSLNNVVRAPSTVLSFFNEQYLSKKYEEKLFSNEKQINVGFLKSPTTLPSLVNPPAVNNIICAGSGPLRDTVALTVMEHVWTDFVYAAFSPCPNKSLRFWNQQPRITQEEWNVLKEGLCPCPPSSAKPITSTGKKC